MENHQASLSTARNLVGVISGGEDYNCVRRREDIFEQEDRNHAKVPPQRGTLAEEFLNWICHSLPRPENFSRYEK